MGIVPRVRGMFSLLLAEILLEFLLYEWLRKVSSIIDFVERDKRRRRLLYGHKATKIGAKQWYPYRRKSLRNVKVG